MAIIYYGFMSHHKYEVFLYTVRHPRILRISFIPRILYSIYFTIPVYSLVLLTLGSLTI